MFAVSVFRRTGGGNNEWRIMSGRGSRGGPLVGSGEGGVFER